MPKQVVKTYDKVKYHFQSERIMERFEKERAQHYEQLNNSLTKRFKIRTHVCTQISDLNLYRKLNIQFFLVEINGNTYRSIYELTEDIAYYLSTVPVQMGGD